MNTCVFCAIADGNAPAEIVREWDDALALHPLDPVTDGHLIVIPRAHVPNFTASAVQASYITLRAAELVASLPEAEGWNLITSAGTAATQTVMHLHVHLVPRRTGDGLALPWTAPATLVPRLTVDGRGVPYFEGQRMEVMSLGTKNRGTDLVEAELHMITRVEYERRRARSGLGRRMQDVADEANGCGRG